MEPTDQLGKQNQRMNTYLDRNLKNKDHVKIVGIIQLISPNDSTCSNDSTCCTIIKAKIIFSL